MGSRQKSLGLALVELSFGSRGSKSLDEDSFRDVFSDVDADEDGRLSWEDVHGALDSFGLLGTIWNDLGLPEDPEARSRQALANHDKDGDGQLSEEEFTALLGQLRELRDALEGVSTAANHVFCVRKEVLDTIEASGNKTPTGFLQRDNSLKVEPPSERWKFEEKGSRWSKLSASVRRSLAGASAVVRQFSLRRFPRGWAAQSAQEQKKEPQKQKKEVFSMHAVHLHSRSREVVNRVSTARRGSVGNAMEDLSFGRRGSKVLPDGSAEDQFLDLDTDGDGSLSWEELHEALDSLGLLQGIWNDLGLPEDPQMRSRQAFANYDKDGDGSLSLAEFNLLVADLRSLRDRMKDVHARILGIFCSPDVDIRAELERKLTDSNKLKEMSTFANFGDDFSDDD